MMGETFRNRLRDAVAHDEEHRRCEELGEGAQVPVTCSCGERWVGAHEFHDLFPRPGECRECDAPAGLPMVVTATCEDPDCRECAIFVVDDFGPDHSDTCSCHETEAVRAWRAAVDS
jgi:hypothetical protein